MAHSQTALHFIWWNPQDLAHFDISRATQLRWPKSRQEYAEKRRRVGEVLRRLSSTNRPSLVALTEITEQAAIDLRDDLYPGYEVFSIGTLYTTPDFHISLIYDASVGFGEEDFLQVSSAPSSTRPIGLVNFRLNEQVIRFYACHWTARFEPASKKWRQKTAEELGHAVYQFLRPDDTVSESRHTVILGDLNEEPFGVLETWLYAHRGRQQSKRAPHFSDKSIQRVHLYNCGWRMLGEHSPHRPTTGYREMAGSYYWRKKRAWRTFDQVIVSGSLLGQEPPFLDEENLRIASDLAVLPDDFLGEDRLPHRFEWKGGHPVGLSDHLPICGSIVLR